MPRCECEHIAHFEHEVGTPKGRPAHLYNCAFLAEDLVTIDTEFGKLKVCGECATDCHCHHLDDAIRHELARMFGAGLKDLVATVAKGPAK